MKSTASVTRRSADVVQNGIGLATDLFGQPVRLDSDVLIAPKGPPCAYGVYVDTHTNAMRPARCRSRSCSHCRRIEAWRITRQIQNEEIVTYSIVPVLCWPTFQKRMKRHLTSYKGIPQPGDPVFYVVFSKEGDRPLPIGDALVAYVDECLKNTLALPRKKNKRGHIRCTYIFRTTHGFGGDGEDDYWAGSRAKSRGRSPWHYVRKDSDILVAELTARNEREARCLKRQDDDGTRHLTAGQVKWILKSEQ